ncbi:hypothetical protein FNU76_18865 [Chitinimonas arctica]|uniref:Uncharacterized protein n=1 Tax=Chitinimonas arctica TaxID=2594795 RepID=A0A516SJC8_9NEIS|nr:PAAR domain-containing protein [Chitinimonas arctica]QDQ28243.1 hypothetical protein FNU76_18865 [Chitinimonas arctica]
MSYGIAVVGLDAAGGSQLGGGQSWFSVDGAPAVLLGDAVAGHGLPPHGPSPSMVQGSSWLTLDGQPVCRAGHAASCGHGSSGRTWFTLPD